MNFLYAFATSALCASAVRVGDGDTDGVANSSAALSSIKTGVAYLKFDKLADCNSDTGGHCSLWSCNQKRGPSSCQEAKCKCSPGYCAGGDFRDEFRTYTDTGKYCFQTCGKAGLTCSDTEIRQDEGFTCAGVSCTKSECCIPRGKCDSGTCDAATEVGTKGTKLCQGAECNPVECCQKRGKCDNFVCPGGTSQKSGSVPLCADTKCWTSECCSVANVEMLLKAEP